MKTFFTVAMFLVMSLAHSQIKVKESKQVFEPLEIGKVGSLGGYHFLCTKLDNTYTISFRDLNYTQIEVYKSFHFEDIDNAFNNLYTIIMDGLENPPEDDILLELPDGTLKIKFVTALGMVNANMSYMENGVSGTSAWLTKRKTRKLFGKKK